MNRAVDLIRGIKALSENSKIFLKPNFAARSDGLSFSKCSVLTTAGWIEKAFVKKLSFILVLLFLILTLTLCPQASAGIVGDIDADGTITPTEAIYALQVAAGGYSSLPSSCLLEGRGAWSKDKDYQACDVVQFDNFHYACRTTHTSSTENQPPDETHWTLLTISPFPPGSGLVIRDKNQNVTHSLNPDGTGRHKDLIVFDRGFEIGVNAPAEKSVRTPKEDNLPIGWTLRQYRDNDWGALIIEIRDENNTLRREEIMGDGQSPDLLYTKYYDKKGKLIKTKSENEATGAYTILDFENHATYKRLPDGTTQQEGTLSVTKAGEGMVALTPQKIVTENPAQETTFEVDTATGNVTTPGVISAGSVALTGPGSGSFTAALDYFLGRDSSGATTFQVDSEQGNVTSTGKVTATSQEVSKQGAGSFVTSTDSLLGKDSAGATTLQIHNETGNIITPGKITSGSQEITKPDVGTWHISPNGISGSDNQGSTTIDIENTNGNIFAMQGISTAGTIGAQKIHAGEASFTGKVTAAEVYFPGSSGGAPASIHVEGEESAKYVNISPNVVVNGYVHVYGVKSAVQATVSYGTLATYCDESTEVNFFDRGETALNDGQITIALDPKFLELTDIEDVNGKRLLVHLTPLGDCKGLFVSARTNTSFTVKELGGGTSSAGFMWEAAAKRKGYAGLRLEKVE